MRRSLAFNALGDDFDGATFILKSLDTRAELRFGSMTDNADETTHPEVDDELLTLARSLSRLFGEIHRLVRVEAQASELTERLEVHLGLDPRYLPVLSQQLPAYQLVDVQIALDEWVGQRPDRTMELIGLSGEQRRFHPLSEMLSGEARGVGLGPVDYVDRADSPDSTRSCVGFGMFLMAEGAHRCAVLLRGDDPHGPMQEAMLEVVAEDKAFGAGILAELRRLAVEHSVLRGQVLALGPGEGLQYGALRFMRRPSLDRDHLVLPEATIEHIEGHIIGIAEHRERLLAAGQHLKRGVLLYGPPGTGKTHTVRYLLSRLRHVTAFMMSGQSLSMIGYACGIARLFQPSLVILEDVDLIAGDRSFALAGSNPLLFEVLNQIDGLGDDVDVTFLLTTNRVDILERALSERPGRVDAAVEIGPPDREGRVKLFQLYGSGLGIGSLTEEELADAVAETEGRTATYIREVVRRAALRSAQAVPTGALRVDGETLATAARDLMEDRAILTRSLLHGPDEPDAEPPGGSSGWTGYAPMASGEMRARRMRHTMLRQGNEELPPPFAPDP